MPSTSESVNALVHFSTTASASSLEPAMAVEQSEVMTATASTTLSNSRISSSSLLQAKRSENDRAHDPPHGHLRVGWRESNRPELLAAHRVLRAASPLSVTCGWS